MPNTYSQIHIHDVFDEKNTIMMFNRKPLRGSSYVCIPHPPSSRLRRQLGATRLKPYGLLVHASATPSAKKISSVHTMSILNIPFALVSLRSFDFRYTHHRHCSAYCPKGNSRAAEAYARKGAARAHSRSPEPVSALPIGRPKPVSALPIGRPKPVSALPIGRPKSVSALPIRRPKPVSAKPIGRPDLPQKFVAFASFIYTRRPWKSSFRARNVK